MSGRGVVIEVEVVRDVKEHGLEAWDVLCFAPQTGELWAARKRDSVVESRCLAPGAVADADIFLRSVADSLRYLGVFAEQRLPTARVAYLRAVR